jgi:hypothetical protein
MKAKLSLLIPLLTIVGLVACTAPIPVSSTSTVATTSTTTTTVTASTIPILVDANGVEIGYRAGVEEIYVPSIRRVIVYVPSQLQEGRIAPQAIWYVSIDCSDAGYTPSTGNGAYGQPKLYAYNSFNGLFTVADNTDSILMRPGSYKGVDGICIQLNPDNLFLESYSAVNFVSVTFSIPLVYPLKFK